MPKQGIIPKCRYHGSETLLVKLGGDGFPFLYLLGGMLDPNNANPGPTFSGVILEAYECPHCGYTELFEAQNG